MLISLTQIFVRIAKKHATLPVCQFKVPNLPSSSSLLLSGSSTQHVTVSFDWMPLIVCVYLPRSMHSHRSNDACMHTCKCLTSLKHIVTWCNVARVTVITVLEKLESLSAGSNYTFYVPCCNSVAQCYLNMQLREQYIDLLLVNLHNLHNRDGNYFFTFVNTS